MWNVHALLQAKQTLADSVSAAEVDGSAGEPEASTHNKQNSHESEVTI